MRLLSKKPYKEDYEIEEELSPSKLSDPQKTIVFRMKAGEIVEIDKENALINFLIDKIHELEDTIAFLKKKEEENRIQSLIDQNEQSRKELEEIFDLDPNEKIDPTKLEGILDPFIKPNQNSAEWVRSVRDSS